MRLLRRSPPRWSDGLSRAAIQEFKDALTSVLAPGDKADWESWPDGVVVDHADGFRSEYALARMSAVYRTAEGDRSTLLADSFAALADARAPLPEDWASARDLLRAKVYPQAVLESERDAFVHQRFARDLVAILQIERAHGFHGVTRDASVKWDVSDDDLWETARTNVHERVPYSEQVQIVNECEVRLLHNEHRLIASHILELERHVGAGAEAVIVSIPDENTVLLHEARDASADRALGYLLAATPQMFAEAPMTGISPHTYWWHDGTLTPLTASDGTYMRYSPPGDFHELMLRLVGGGELPWR